MSAHPLEEILHPRSIAVAGASDNPNSAGSRFAKCLLDYGFQGNIYPVNPKHSVILGLDTYPSIDQVPGNVDYVISAIPAAGVLDLMEGCARKGVKAVHFFTARFSETGRREAVELERELLRRAKAAGIRIIGPNCMGLYDPARGISFSDAMPKKAGRAGLVSQSGQLAEEIARYAALKGVYFSKAISYGNAIDLNECDFLEYLAQDQNTSEILMYIEGLRDGRRFFRSLRQAASRKPVVILKGGRGRSGSRAAASHTASLSGSQALWKTLVMQTGAVSAEHLEELIDLAVGFYLAPPIRGIRVGVAGGGGGASVLSADQCEEAGLDVVPLPDEIRQELKRSGSGIWDWIGNPADMSIRDQRDFTPGHMLELMAKNDRFDLLIAIMSEPHHDHQKGMTAEDYLKQFRLEKKGEKPLLAVVPELGPGIDRYDHWSLKVISGVRTRLLEAGVPFYPTVWRAAHAARKIAGYYGGIERASGSSPAPA